MPSPTVRTVAPDQVAELMRVAFGAHVAVADYTPMTDGGFAGRPAGRPRRGAGHAKIRGAEGFAAGRRAGAAV